jgi:hypothetical protein
MVFLRRYANRDDNDYSRATPGFASRFGRTPFGTYSRYQAVPSSTAHPLDLSNPSGTRSTLLGGSETLYHIEPFVLPASNEDTGAPLPDTSPIRTYDLSHRLSLASRPAPSTSHGESESSPSGRGGGGNVYVVHHDAGRAPVTVYTPDGTEVVELPPRYGEGSSRNPQGRSPSGWPRDRESVLPPSEPPWMRRRESGAIPRKDDSLSVVNELDTF